MFRLPGRAATVEDAFAGRRVARGVFAFEVELEPRSTALYIISG
jgi:hypothetical protein